MPVLSLEISTTSAKAAVFDAANGILSSAIEPLLYDAGGRGRMDAVGAYQTLLRVGKRAARGHEIAAVALSFSWHTLLVCDARFEPVTPVYTWEYDGAKALSAAMRADSRLTDLLYQTTGCMPNITYPRQTLLYLIEEGLKLWGRRVMSQGAFCFQALTGEFAETANIQSGSGLINLITLDYDPFVMELLGIGADQLGALRNFRDTSPLLPEAARMLGVSPGIPVVPAHSDGACNHLASSAEYSKGMTLSVGTSGAMRLAVNEPRLSPKNETWAYYGVDGHLAGAAVAGACNCIDWFKADFLQNRLSYADLEGEEHPPALDPPVFLPFLFGERCPGWRDDRLAGFAQVRPGHRPRHFYHAIQMGILFNLYQCFGNLCAVAGDPEAVIVSGGILHSRLWTGMLADIFQRPVTLSKDKDASLTGASLLGLYAAGEIRSIHQKLPCMGQGETVINHPDLASWYQNQYRRYQKAYHHTQPAYAEQPE